MKPSFPRKNLAVNALIAFRETSNVYSYTQYFKFQDPNDKQHLEWKFEHLIKLFDLLEDEIHQVIHTNNDKTIRLFFDELKANIAEWNLLNVDKEDFLEKIKVWNEKTYLEFETDTAAKENEFFSKPERTKYKHLEPYESTYPSLFNFKQFTKSTIINKNFYCIENIPRLIDVDYLDKYLSLLNQLTQLFDSKTRSSIKLYDDEKLIEGNKKNLFEEIKEKALNNKLFVGILIGMALLKGCDEVVQIIKNNTAFYNENFKSDPNVKTQPDTLITTKK